MRPRGSGSIWRSVSLWPFFQIEPVPPAQELQTLPRIWVRYICIMKLWLPTPQATLFFPCGAIAQLGERIVRNDEVAGSRPASSTILSITCGTRSALHAVLCRRLCRTPSAPPEIALSSRPVERASSALRCVDSHLRVLGQHLR